MLTPRNLVKVRLYSKSKDFRVGQIDLTELQKAVNEDERGVAECVTVTGLQKFIETDGMWK